MLICVHFVPLAVRCRAQTRALIAQLVPRRSHPPTHPVPFPSRSSRQAHRSLTGRGGGGGGGSQALFASTTQGGGRRRGKLLLLLLRGTSSSSALLPGDPGSCFVIHGCGRHGGVPKRASAVHAGRPQQRALGRLLRTRVFLLSMVAVDTEERRLAPTGRCCGRVFLASPVLLSRPTLCYPMPSLYCNVL